MSNLRIERDDATAIVTMARPDKRNALSLEMMRELRAAFATLGDDRTCRAVVLAADGPAFSAGHDLRELHGGNDDAFHAIFDECVRLMETIQSIPQPVIAEIDGVATAAGCQLVATCDLAAASNHSRFATPGVKIGLFCSTPMVALSRAIGRKRALEMLLTGEMISAETAADWGLINRVVAKEYLRGTTLAVARNMEQFSSEIIGLGKAAFYRQIDMAQPDAYAYTKDVMIRNAGLADAREGIAAFLDKREPVWRPYIR